MSGWSIFWICLFSYWAIKESVYCLTYNKRQAIKELAREKNQEQIDKLAKMSKEELVKELQELINELDEDEEK